MQKNHLVHGVFACRFLMVALCMLLFPDFVNVSPKNHLQIMGRYVDVVS